MLEVLHSERFADAAPATVYVTPLDEGTYLAGESTMYRLLRERGETDARRRRATHPAKVKPELVASAPNRVWSWDITKLHGPAKWTCYYRYVILDIFSRYPVGWMVASRESATLAERLITEVVRKRHVDRGQLTLHADRGSSMASKPVAFLLVDLGVTKSHSRPHCSNDNRYSEAQFKTLKYRPDFPDRFGCTEDARVFCVGVTTDRAPAYPRVLDELVPTALDDSEQYANNRVEADHGRLKARLRPMRGLKIFRSARIPVTGQVFVRTSDAATTPLPSTHRFINGYRRQFDELALVIARGCYCQHWLAFRTAVRKAKEPGDSRHRRPCRRSVHRTPVRETVRLRKPPSQAMSLTVEQVDAIRSAVRGWRRGPASTTSEGASLDAGLRARAAPWRRGSGSPQTAHRRALVRRWPPLARRRRAAS